MFGLDNNVLLGLVGVVVVFFLMTNKKSFKSLMKKDMLVIVGLTLVLVCCLAKDGRVIEGFPKNEGDNPMNIATLFNSLEYLNPELHFTPQCTQEVRDGLRNAGVAIKDEMCDDREAVDSLLNAMIEANLFTDAATHLKTNISNRCK